MTQVVGQKVRVSDLNPSGVESKLSCIKIQKISLLLLPLQTETPPKTSTRNVVKKRTRSIWDVLGPTVSELESCIYESSI